MVQGNLGEPDFSLGTKRHRRFCGETSPCAFRNVAHTLPEAFGNEWVTSLDECAPCDARFSRRLIQGAPKAGSTNFGLEVLRSVAPRLIEYQTVKACSTWMESVT